MESQSQATLPECIITFRDMFKEGGDEAYGVLIHACNGFQACNTVEPEVHNPLNGCRRIDVGVQHEVPDHAVQSFALLSATVSLN